MLTAVSLITMPVTQHLWTWDHFLRGGQDFELGMLVILTFLCLVLVLSRHSKQGVDSLFAAWRLRTFILNDRALVRIPLLGAFSLLCAERMTSPGSGMYNLPLQI